MADDVKIKAQVYKDPRPAEEFERYHERVRDHPPEWVYEGVRITTIGLALTLFRLQGYGAENVPNGPVIIAPNHASFMDHFFAGAFVRRHIQFMAKSQMFGPHVMSWVYNHGGVFPVRRGHADEEAFKTAFAILARGGAIGMYVEGGARAVDRSARTRRPGSAGWRSSLARRLFPSRFSDPTRFATGRADASPRSSSATASRSALSSPVIPARKRSRPPLTRSCGGSVRCTLSWRRPDRVMPRRRHAARCWRNAQPVCAPREAWVRRLRSPRPPAARALRSLARAS